MGGGSPILYFFLKKNIFGLSLIVKPWCVILCPIGPIWSEKLRCAYLYIIYIIFRCEILRNQVNPILQNTSLCKMHCCTELDFNKQQSFRRMQSLKLIHCSLFISDRKSVEAKDFGPCISLLVLCWDCTSVYFNLQWSKITMVQ